MALLLREADVRALLPMTEAIRLVRSALMEHHSGDAFNQPRQRIKQDKVVFSSMSASVPGGHSVGLKAYVSSQAGTGFVVLLWDSEEGSLLALLEADWLGRIRTGAASGVATDLLAKTTASSAAIIGTGSQASTQLEALTAVRSLTSVRVYSRNADRRTEFAAFMRDRLGIDVQPAASARDAVDGADVVSTITSSGTPVVEGRWIGNGTHVNAAGSNQPSRREIDTNLVRVATVVAVDSLVQARIEAGDLLIPEEEGQFTFDRAVELGAILSSTGAGRTTHEEITLFKSLGVAVEDIAVARYVYERAMEQGRGDTVSFGLRPNG